MKFLSLNLLIFSPLIVPLFFMLPIFRGHEVFIRRFAKSFAGLHFLYTLCFWLFFNPEATYFSEPSIFGQSGIQSLGIRTIYTMDGLSLALVVLTSFLVLMATIASKTCIRKRHKLYYGLIFLLETAILGVFTAGDMFLFFFFWELELIPMYFLISLWGSGNAQKSAMKFILYTFLGSMFMLVGILLLHYFNDTINLQMSSLFTDVNLVDKLPINIQILISILLMIGFFVKMPVIPLHTWLPNAHVDAPTPVSMLLAGLLLKLGAYGFIRLNILLLPDAFKLIAPILIIFAVINIIHSALVAYNQQDIKKLVAYSSISNMGIVLLGLCAINEVGLSGGIFQMISHGLISAGLFMIVGIIYTRTRTRDFKMLGGLATVMPTLMGFSILFSMASVGMPLMSGFIGEFLSFWGAFNCQLETPILIPALVFVSISVLVLSVAYMLKFLHRAFYGNILEGWKNIRDISTHEFVILSSIAGIIVFLGIFPMTILNVISSVVELIVESVGI